MADVLSSGPGWDGGPGEQRRRAARMRRWASAATVVVAGSVLALFAVRDGTGRPPAARTPTPTAPAPTSERLLPRRLPPAAIFRVEGTVGPGPAGVRLLLGGRHPGSLDARTGRLTPLPGLRAGGGEIELRRSGGLTVATVFSPQNNGMLATVLPDGGPPVDFGTVADVLPMRDGTVLSTSSCGPDFIACVLASRDAGGARRWQRRVPGALDLVRDTPYGTLTLGFDASATDGLLRLGDPRTGRVRRDFGRTGFALAASDRQVAWRAPGCERPACPISVADLASGTVKTVHLPAGYTSVGTFSPDGRKLAIGFQGLHEQDPTPIRRRDGYVAVVDLATGRWVRAPGLTTGPKSSPAPVWTPDGSELLVVAADDGAGRVVRWRPGADRITVLPTELDGIYPGQRTVLVLG